MTTRERYRAPAAMARGELREKGSRFLAIVGPVEAEATARAQIEKLRQAYADASHVCWAWRLGHPGRERSSDAGEPAGTAGTPILQVLRGSEISDVLAVVVRWFGGVKLGKGGLARAYAGATRLAVEGLRLQEQHPVIEWVVTLPYERVGDLRRLVHPPVVQVVDEEYGERLTVRLRVFEAQSNEVRQALAARGVDIEPVEPSRG